MARDTEKLVRRAVEHQRQGSSRDAERQLRKALKNDPKHLEAGRFMAQLMLGSGRRDEAWSVLDPLAEAHPKDLALQQMAAQLALQTGNPSRALEIVGRLEFGPEDHALIALVARAESAAGEQEVAEKRLREALERSPDDMGLLAALAMVLRNAGRLRDAIEVHRKLAVRPEPRTRLAARSNVAALLRELGCQAEALDELGRALAVAPQSVELLRNRSLFLRELGRIDDAVEVLRRALAIEPDNAETRRALAWTRNHRDATDGDEELAWWRAHVEKPETAGMTKHDAWFAWARILSQLGRRDEEIPFLQRANEERRRVYPFDGEQLKERYRAIADAFDAETLGRLQSTEAGGNPDEAPVFVVGLPRSGGTLVEQILSSHSRVHGAGELPDLGQVLSDPGLVPDGEIVNLISLGAAERSRVAAAYLARIRERAPDALRVVDKLPHNFERIGAILALFPNARIVHVRRDPRDCAASILRSQFDGDLRYAYDPRDLSTQFTEYRRLCDHWRAVVPEQNLLEVRYEAVVEDLETEARRLIDFLGLEWEPSCLEFHRTERVVTTLSQEQVRQPIYRSSIGTWEAYRDLLGPALEPLAALDG